MKKRIIIAMTAVSLATGFLSFGQRKSEKMDEEPFCCPGECCMASDQSSDQCWQEIPATVADLACPGGTRAPGF